ncbi:polysaccharide deacetylase family protein [Amycolatopsis pithecellobii]|uniref:Polysaccharide deacetylase family protein n=1 Tax=Amycolatopsis pithecellobii TaxID=664692 RepID=A0A6N7Z4T6_9PSEU|nr:polysaccharide deacetylase [Amycolatopsis pithecellobii]MTD55434.1 polysaccharide deacetylase family protein [Amycolatopsis pithecellobii]
MVDEASAWNQLPLGHWPQNAIAAVAISVDADNETLALSRGMSGPGLLSQGQYGARVGLPRVLDTLRRHSVPATFFYPVVSAKLDPAGFAAVNADGHEIGLHGWIHEKCGDLTAEQERELALRSAEALEVAAGVRPVGLRTAYWDFTVHTLPIIRELGLEYDSSLMADDQPYELLHRGEATGVTEVPVSWIRDDAPYFPDDALGKQVLAPHEVLRIWQDEFDAAYSEGGLFTLALHPHIIGHRSRIKLLDELLTHITSHSGVWFTTHAEVAQHAAARRTLPAK